MPRPPLAPLLLAIWVLEIAGMAWQVPGLREAQAVLSVLIVANALAWGRRAMRVLIAALIAAIVVVAWATDSWAAIPHGVMLATVLAPFLFTLVMLRAVADVAPQISRARALFAKMAPAERAGGIMIGAHLIGSLLNLGAVALIAPIAADESDHAARRAVAGAMMRGFCAVATWSPFWVAIAVATQHQPGVPLWQIVGVGIVLSLASLVVAHLMYGGGVGLGRLARASAGLLPLALPVGLCAGLVVILTSASGLSTVRALILIVPALCALGIALYGARRIATVAAGFWRGVGNIGDEVAMVVSALTLGRVIEAALHQAGPESLAPLAQLGGPGLIAAFLFGTVAVALAGIHPMVSATVILAVGAALPGLIHPLVLVSVALVVWGTSTTIGLASVMLAMSAAMFRLTRRDLVWHANLWFVLAYSATACALLAGLNALIR